jgi:DNA transformation protein
MIPSDLIEQLQDVLAPLGPVVVKRMFGGAGLFLDGLMFALVSDDALYFKVDGDNRGRFEVEGMAPFSYAKSGGRTAVMSYWQAPERLLDEPDEMLAFARDAVGAARRVAARKAGNPRRPRKGA